MAVPKKKSSRSRRNMRRYSAAYALEPMTSSTCPHTQTTVRAHTISIKSLKDGSYKPRAKKTPNTASA
jgi:ribosomal protein L32